ncbi:sorting nexin-11 [Ictalurus furcatus]|uniref:sorting nexin-11 n=1 Tax=Ictalurus furcatus TaxID=66913 RepID=UPI00235058FE|nr:sorting nexin-11 [Ictalurus furcatus]XP_053496719.1 sorting nexin-11 [Ictalurus furcatus]
MCSFTTGRMIKSQEDEFITVRVQDPRVMNEGSWNSYVDFKIFLYTNSKAFTAKTSCVRRRYSEFVWLKQKLQKNAGLVPVPDLPGKSFIHFNNTDFIEKRRKGLQSFLDKVVHMTVCLSDSQLHLFLQTQLPVSHIQDCVKGHTPYSVTDAILTYASSNRGWAQEEGGGPLETCPTPISYESIESPSPNVPSLQHEEGAVDEPDLNSVDLRLQEDDTTIHNRRDGQEGRVQDGESCERLEVDVHQQVPILDIQNTKEGSGISILDEQKPIHDNTKDSIANGVEYVVSQAPTEADKSQLNHVANNNKLVNFFF